uniref:Uncharacterized protein LOC111101985 n=1 Tax=Crassostrea virginica TaxID=6565 RepID=A0A8B8AFT1_CRAVI|nr:uncharacterized protein LOC111101985 [Crassostrea virginica]
MTCLQVVPNFNNETLVNCRDDLLLSGYRGFVQWHLDAALEQCQTYVQLNSSFQRDNAYVSTNIVDLCPKNCSDKGVCFKGNCTCDKGYGGSDCSFDVSSPPTITKLSDDGICDKSEETCEDITLYGHYFLENMETQCFMTREEVNEHSFVMSTTSYTVRLEESTLYEGYCSLQYNSDTSWITLFHFRLSKDATQFSETYTVYVYQSECQTFHNNSGVITFTLQSGYCFIKGTCIQSGMTHVNQSCWRCSPQMDAYDWTWVSECDIEGTTYMSVVRTTEITETHSAVTETNENHVKRNSADDSQQPDLETVGLSVAVAFIALITFEILRNYLK